MQFTIAEANLDVAELPSQLGQDVAAAVARRPASERRRLLHSASGFLLLLAILWIVFEIIGQSIPYTRQGSTVIAATKWEAARSQRLFSPAAARRVLFVGDSRTLAGIKPAQFDSAMGPGFSSFNAGLPNDRHFMPFVELALGQGQIPTDIVSPIAWSAPVSKPNILADDDALMGALFPFARVPRDVTLFTLRAQSRGGVRAFYAECQRSVSRMLDDRGYYFIEGQSHFPGDRLPAGFHSETDDPASILARQGDPNWPEFARLRQIGRQYHIHVWFVPAYYRQGHCAPAPAQNAAWSAAMAHAPEFTSLGPDYWLFPLEDFSDPVHVNRVGADVYTNKLIELLRPAMQGAGLDAKTASGRRR